MGAHRVLEAAGFRLTSLGDSWAVHDVADPAAITRTLADAGHYLSELSPMAADLESVFLELTSGPGHGRGADPGAVPPPDVALFGGGSPE